MWLGNDIQGELDNVKLGKGKNAQERRAARQQALLERILFGKKGSTKGRFRDPAEMLKGG